MNIAYIITNSYISQFGISYISLLENNKSLSHLDTYLLSPDLSSESMEIAQKIASKYNKYIHFIDISNYKDYFQIPVSTSGFHPIVLARLLLAEYLSKDLSSILYLDCDVIVNGSLAELNDISDSISNTSFENIAIAAVPELYMPPRQKRAIGLSDTDTYFNAGAFLANLTFWRNHKLTNTFVNYYLSCNGNLLYNDQDIMNHCCKGHIYPLSHKYNLSPALKYFPRFFIKSYQPAYYCKNASEYKKILQNPVIIHFLGDERPWLHGNYNPYRETYRYYKALSPWKDEPDINGKEFYLLCYHLLNCITAICPWFRKLFTEQIGIYIHKIRENLKKH